MLLYTVELVAGVCGIVGLCGFIAFLLFAPLGYSIISVVFSLVIMAKVGWGSWDYWIGIAISCSIVVLFYYNWRIVKSFLYFIITYIYYTYYIYHVFNQMRDAIKGRFDTRYQEMTTNY